MYIFSFSWGILAKFFPWELCGVTSPKGETVLDKQVCLSQLSLWRLSPEVNSGVYYAAGRKHDGSWWWCSYFLWGNSGRRFFFYFAKHEGQTHRTAGTSGTPTSLTQPLHLQWSPGGTVEHDGLTGGTKGPHSRENCLCSSLHKSCISPPFIFPLPEHRCSIVPSGTRWSALRGVDGSVPRASKSKAGEHKQLWLTAH